MSEVVGDSYSDEHAEEVPKQHGTRPGEGPNDAPATTGTHRGWGDPQPGEQIADESSEEDEESSDE
jgi:hypothetical protein